MRECVVCVSTMMWDGLPTRKQRFMRHLALRGYDVLYAEPPLSLLAPLRQPELVQGVGLRAKTRQISAGLHVLTPGLGLPGAGGTLAALQDVRYRQYYGAIRAACRELNLRPTVHWAYTAEAARFVGALGERRVVFDGVDDLAHYPGVDSARAAALQEQLVCSADLVITSARGLHDRWSALNPNTAFIPNGYDDGLFYPPRAEDPLDEAILETIAPGLAGRSLAVFVGGIYEWIDLELLERVARDLPMLLFVVAGPVGKGVDTSTLRRMDNVRLPGRVDVMQAAALVRSAVVCLNPFRSGPLTESVNPLKVYEYLGAGKACVTTPMPELEPLRDVLLIAEGPDEFAGLVARASTEDDSRVISARVAAVKPYRWSFLCERAEHALREVL